MEPRRAKKPPRVMLVRVSSLVNLDGWFGMFFKPIVLDALCSSHGFPDSELQASFPSAPFHVLLGW